jgi:hypothetical protein
MLTIVNNVIHVDLLVQEKRHVSFMYFCTHDLLRNNMLIELNMLPVNIDILLFGNDNLPVEINTFIFSCVQKYIKDTWRFS